MLNRNRNEESVGISVISTAKATRPKIVRCVNEVIVIFIKKDSFLIPKSRYGNSIIPMQEIK